MYKEKTSIVGMMVSGGRWVGRDQILSRKWFVSWIWEGFNKGLEVGADVSRDVWEGEMFQGREAMNVGDVGV